MGTSEGMERLLNEAKRFGAEVEREHTRRAVRDAEIAAAIEDSKPEHRASLARVGLEIMLLVDPHLAAVLRIRQEAVDDCNRAIERARRAEEERHAARAYCDAAESLVGETKCCAYWREQAEHFEKKLAEAERDLARVNAWSKGEADSQSMLIASTRRHLENQRKLVAEWRYRALDNAVLATLAMQFGLEECERLRSAVEIIAAFVARLRTELATCSAVETPCEEMATHCDDEGEVWCEVHRPGSSRELLAPRLLRRIEEVLAIVTPEPLTPEVKAWAEGVAATVTTP
jgi:hypothetical protein